MKKVLWVSFRVPYDKVAHAGGKIHNFYLKKLNESKKFDIRLISFYRQDELPKIDLDFYGINHELIDSTIIENQTKGFNKLLNKIYKISILNRYLDLTTRNMCKQALNKILELSINGYKPEIIILQWTQIVALEPEIRKIYPESKIVSIEEDVTFLAAIRRKNLTNNIIKKIYYSMESKSIKRIEKNCLEDSQLVILNNNKDLNLIINNRFEVNSWVWTPYFQNMIDFKHNYNGKKELLFYGAMSRPENWKSAIWFIENVFSVIKDDGYSLLIVGNNPPKELIDYRSENIKIMGYVEDIRPYFENSLCLVAPLLLGAGVKIKILESMSCGLPVLTNDIGIEGISAVKGRDFLYSVTPKDYIDNIYILTNSLKKSREIGNNAKNFILKNYNFIKDAELFSEKLEELSS